MDDLLGRLLVKIVSDASDFESGIGAAESKMKAVGQRMTSIGAALTGAVTLPLVGIGAAALKSAEDINGMMANVASLGIGSERTKELKGDIQDLAIAVGKGTDDMAGGLYQVISAFGDSEDSIASLQNAARAGAAGLAATTDAINLVSAVTKGYGDTSIEAQRKVSDLAFETVKLGQTTFPELASSMGKVVPLAAALGVSQETLFAQMATLTGVTGSASEVSTQLRATYQSMLSPTRDMASAISTVAENLDKQGRLAGGELVDNWRDARAAWQTSAEKLATMRQQLDAMTQSGTASKTEVKDLADQIRVQEKATDDAGKATEKAAAALGQSIVQSVGLSDALTLLSAQAGGNTDTLTSMFGSVEALNAVLALSGGQSDTFQQKLAAMGDAAGATDEAFAAQTEGINKMGFTMAQVWTKVEVLMQKLGDGLAPTMMRLLDNPIAPLIDKVVAMADWFANADSGTQDWIITIATAAAAVGPALVVLGTLISAVSSIVGVFSAASAAIPVVGTVLAALTGPVGLIVAAIGGLAYAWYNNWGGIRDFTDSIFGHIDLSFSGLKDKMANTWEGITAISQLGWDDYKAMADGALGAVENALGLSQGTIKTKFSELWANAAETVYNIDWAGLGTGIIKAIVGGIVAVGSALSEAANNIAGGFWSGLQSAFGANVQPFSYQQTTPVNTMPSQSNYAASTYNITVNLSMLPTGANDAQAGARTGVLEALRAVGMG